MCGICGILDLKRQRRIDDFLIKKMTKKLLHRGPDGIDFYIGDNIAFGFTRLSIIDLQGGMQPILNEDGSLVMVCNGEIFNYIELRRELIDRGHRFKTNTDVEVLIHLYEEAGPGFLNQLNGQFAFAIFDLQKHQLFCSRDIFGVIPFFYTIADDFFIFASEIKSILEHPGIKREVDLTGLDQVFSFPGLISPRTMFKDIRSLENGHYLIVKGVNNSRDFEYWDLDYPEVNEMEYNKNEEFYIERLHELIKESVRFRLRSDVPIGIYISGGLDSSIILAITRELAPDKIWNSFAIDFVEKGLSEKRYQRIMSEFVDSVHHERLFLFSDISENLAKVIYHCECPLKETYNLASLALSESVREQNIKVVLSGEGADEFFAGYVGYRFDIFRKMQGTSTDLEHLNESRFQEKIWGDNDFFYEKNYNSFTSVKRELYSDLINDNYEEIDCFNHPLIKKEKLKNRDRIHKRSYIDFKLRLVDHLVSDHGDRMALANSVETRYPFLDRELVEFVRIIPPDLKLKGFEEKYILKKMAASFLPKEIVKREKFAFVAPGSQYLLKKNIEYINDLISFDRIKRQGFLNPDKVEKLKKQYMNESFKLNLPFDDDLLITVITFGIFLDTFELKI